MNRIKKYLILYLGFFLAFIGILIILFQIIKFSAVIENEIPNIWWLSIEFAYIAFVSIIIGVGVFLSGFSTHWIRTKRYINNEDFEAIVFEVESLNGDKKEEFDKAQNQIKILRKLSQDRFAYDNNIQTSEEIDERLIEQKNSYLYEVEILPLKKLVVDLYDDSVLETKAQEELWQLWNYAPDTPTYENRYEEWKKRINQKLTKLKETKENNENSKGDLLRKELRSDIKELRDAVVGYDKTWAIGEVYINSISYWAASAVLIMVVIGILPLIHFNGDGYLTILHWATLGWSGAMLSTIVGVNKLNTNEVGEEDGKQALLKTVGKIAIGVITPILLYAALQGKILSGAMFPELPINSGNNPIGTENYWLYTGMSIFWGIFAGFSLKILTGLVSVAEGAFAKHKSSD